MSGVIDENGVQWEHCTCCHEFVPLDSLGYIVPCTIFKHGRDVCVKCADRFIRNGEVDFDNVRPAASWLVQEISE